MKKSICKECGHEKEVFETYEHNVIELAERLTKEEVLSLLKSNRFSWSLRKQIKLVITLDTIKNLIPVIAAVGIASAIVGMFQDVLGDKYIK